MAFPNLSLPGQPGRRLGEAIPDVHFAVGERAVAQIKAEQISGWPMIRPRNKFASSNVAFVANAAGGHAAGGRTWKGGCHP